MNNRTLLLIFLGGLAVFFGTKFLRKDHSSSFDPVISAIDTARVDRINFISATPDHEGFELERSDSGWVAKKGNTRVEASSANIGAVLSQLADLNAERVVTKDAGRYAEYEITDSIATRVIAFDGERKLIDLWIGGFRFDQAARSASAFVRKEGKPEVYEVDGFVVMSLKQRFDQYRDKTIVNIDPDDLSKLEWINATGRKETLQKEDGVWHYAGMEAVDSTKMKSYLTTLTNSRGSEFANENPVSGKTAFEKLTLYGNNMVQPIVISAYENNDALKPFLIHSSINPDAVFLSDSMGIYKQVFADIRQFWPDGQ